MCADFTPPDDVAVRKIAFKINFMFPCCMISTFYESSYINGNALHYNIMKRMNCSVQMIK